jgi:chromosome segregation ATPase
MRFTPQPQRASVAEKEHEVTHISDSMPGTAALELDLQRASAPADEAVREEQEAHRAEQRHFRESEIMWDKQQGKHEDLARDYRVQKGKLSAAETRVETLTKNNATLTERLTTRTAEMRDLDQQLQEQRATDLLSPDAQIAEITKLRKELAEARAEKDKAIQNASSAESLLEYTRGAYQDAQNAASSNAARVKELEEEVKKLSSAASGEATKRKGMHLNQNYDRQQKQIASLEAQLTIYKRTLQSKEEEIVRLRSVGRPGVGTRGTSATPQPKTRSRAGSPTFIGGRVSNLRNS